MILYLGVSLTAVTVVRFIRIRRKIINFFINFTSSSLCSFIMKLNTRSEFFMSRIMQKEIKSEMNDFFFAKDHLDFYHEYVNVEQMYLAGIKEVRTKLEILDDEFHHRFDHNPIHHMEWRLKSPHSVVEKMKRRNLPVDVSSIKGNIEDIAGIRVICHYIKDIYRISNLLLRQDDIHLLKVKDYIKNPKENGYRSLHLVVEVPVYLANEKVMVPVEIQIRTIAMDFWATLEHHLRYKNNKEISDDIRNRLYECAKNITDIDYEMEDIHNEVFGHHKI